MAPEKRYHAEWLDSATGERLLLVEGLHEELRELRIGLPAALLPPGRYLLRVLASAPEGPELIAEYPLWVQRE